MNNFIKKTLRIIALTILFLVLAIAIFLAYISITDYKPEAIEVIVEKTENIQPLAQETFSFINWNIGYAGLGSEMDFFYDGGVMSMPTKKLSEKYLENITNFIINSDTVDFWLLQEVDAKAKRSYNVNQVEHITNAKKGSYGVMANNYIVQYVPVPLSNPMGYVNAGLMTFSDFPPTEAIRYAYPLIASWPDKLFLLDRCFLLNRYPTKSGKDIVIINTHNSAYVYDSVLRIEELQILKTVILDEYGKGNYVIVGGDWNQNPPKYLPVGDYNKHKFITSEVKMNTDFMPKGWTWAFDGSAPTNRSNYKPFIIGENTTTCLDYYLTSPNIEVIDVEVIDLKFKDSDHNPVYLKIKI